jgi:SAM-dependent methyltransferase
MSKHLAVQRVPQKNGRKRHEGGPKPLIVYSVEVKDKEKVSRFIISILLGVLILPGPYIGYGGQEIFDVWQQQFIIPGSDGTPLDVPYVPTEDYIGRHMLRLLELRQGDVLYDLGCGDGRLVIGAAKVPGVRGVGIDLDPRRIQESRANALAAGVTDRTVFVQQDLFQSDIRDATAVTLFLLPEINLKLRPKLFRDLRPGTRIVSHNFHMGDWKPDRSVFVGLWFDGPHYLYYWVLPANVSGLWRGWKGKDLWSLSITQQFQGVKGSLSINGGPAIPLSQATVMGEKVGFVAPREHPQRSITFNGTATGNVIEGTAREAGGAGSLWRATRDPGTASTIE